MAGEWQSNTAVVPTSNQPGPTDSLLRAIRWQDAWPTITCALLLLGGLVFGWQGDSAVAAACFFLAMLFGGFEPAVDGLKALRKGYVDIDLLMVAAAAGAASIGRWQDGAILIFIFSLSHTLEHYALGKTRRAIRSLIQLRPAEAWVLRGPSPARVPVESLRTGEVVLVRPGERIPVDGTVVAGSSAVDQSPITGESIPVEKAIGATVYAGTVNQLGALEVQMDRSVEDTTLARIIQMVEAAQAQKAPTQLFIEGFERVYATGVVLFTLLMAVVPPFLWGWDWSTTLYRAMTLMVVASPCAVVLSTMPAILSGIARGARQGVLFKGGSHLEGLGGVRAIAFDKTGTLTIGRPEVTDVIPLTAQSPMDVLAVAAAVEVRSEHPLAQAVVAAARAAGVETPAADDVRAIPGRGVEARVAGRQVWVGSAEMATQRGLLLATELNDRLSELAEEGKTVMIVGDEKSLLGVIAAADVVRPDAPDVMRRLREMGIERTVMLTGDHAVVAAGRSRQVGVDEFHAELLPEEKVYQVQRLLHQYGSVAMVGDGVNDAPALAVATVGIAMGGAGTDVALETADVVLMSDDLKRLPDAIHLARSVRRVVLQNLTFAFTVIGLLLALTFLGSMNLTLGVMAHEGSTLLVALNGIRLLAHRTRRDERKAGRQQDAGRPRSGTQGAGAPG